MHINHQIRNCGMESPVIYIYRYIDIEQKNNVYCTTRLARSACQQHQLKFAYLATQALFLAKLTLLLLLTSAQYSQAAVCRD